MTRVEKRKAIARDALAWIQTGALVPEQGCYLRPISAGACNILANVAAADTQLRDLALGPCEVCAVGALVAAKACRFDRVSVGAWRDMTYHYGSGAFGAILGEFFSVRQCRRIEGAFEGWDEESPDQFVRRYPSAKDRLVAILKRIIADPKGEFHP
jgi:hypothetical protein